MALNGRLASRDLATIPGTTQRVRADLLNQTSALRLAFEARFGKALRVTDGYRDYNSQVRVFTARYTRIPLPGRPTKIWNGVRYWQKPWTAMAATPGTSNHGWGTALDLGSGVNSGGSAEHNWMLANGSRFGWTWPSWWARAAGEWWHFEAAPVPVSKYRDYLDARDLPTPGGTTPAPITERDWLDMATKAEVQEAFAEANAPVIEAIDRLYRVLATRLNSNSADELEVLREVNQHLKTRLNSNSADTLNVAREIRDQG